MSSTDFTAAYQIAEDDVSVKPPYFDGALALIGGKVSPWTGELVDIKSPIQYRGGKPIVIGRAPNMGETEAVAAVHAAAAAYNNGLGEWCQYHPKQRILVVEKYLTALKGRRDEIVRLLMWEICKTREDSEKEVDRTLSYMTETIAELKKMENESSTYVLAGGIIGHIRRAPLGVVLCLGPFNYPFNETYCTFIPALIMGNTVVMKLPNTGLLTHLPTLQLFADIFPAGVVNVISGRGRSTIPPMMKTGLIDVFAFIGTSKAAATIIKDHPAPNRLRTCLGLDAKNPAFVLADADLTTAVNEVILGALSYNGQRCTAIKIVFVHSSLADVFVPKLVAAVDALKIGLPWTDGVKLTPLPEPDKPTYLQELISDALSKGAKVVNPRGNHFSGSIATPTVLYPVSSDMRVYNEEQFGPIVPVATFESESDIHTYLLSCSFGQQAAIFGTDPVVIGRLIDVLVNVVARVNINTQCQRGPDSFPFTGRKNSAAGTLSIRDALRVFSIRSTVATKQTEQNTHILSDITARGLSHFCRLDHIF